MSVTLLQQEPSWRIRFDGAITVSCLADLKSLLLRWLTAARDLELDLTLAEEIDPLALQLLYAAEREATRRSLKIMALGSSAVLAATRESGFAQLPGFPFQE